MCKDASLYSDIIYIIGEYSMNEKELEEIVEKIIESTELFTMYVISLIRLTNSMRALAKTGLR